MVVKKLTDNALLGEQGIAHISLAVSKMGFVWRPTSQHDTGIDGEIEIRDSATGAVSGLIIKVQSKALTTLLNDSDEGFDYWPSPTDVAYWLGHNVPVILVVSQPATEAVYWQTVERPSGPASPKKFHFSKVSDKLDDASRGRLIELAKGGAPGAKGFALAKPERLVCNLLPVTGLPPRLYLAETDFKTPKELGTALHSANLRLDFVLKNNRILSVTDLNQPQYWSFCDRGTIEDFPVSEWSSASEPDKQRDFVGLLNQCLRQVLSTSVGHIRFDKALGLYYFPSNKKNQPYEFGYRSLKKATSREVVTELISKKEKHVMGYRHSAMFARFFQYDKKWYLEIMPSYLFTQPNGLTTSRFHSDWLTGIKKLERNSAILGQLVMWEELLSSSDDLLSEGSDLLEFGKLLSFQSEHGIADDAWTASVGAEATSSEPDTSGLFEWL